MKGCDSAEEPECTGFWCSEWGFCEFSLSAMYEDSSERDEWIKELKRQSKKLPRGATAAWRKFLRKRRTRDSFQP